MTEIHYDAVPPPIRAVINQRMLRRIEALPVTHALAIDALLTATGGPMIRARVRSRQRRGEHAARADTRSIAVDVMLPDLDDEVWRTWFTLRLRGPYVRDLVALLTASVPDDPAGLDGPQTGTQSR